ncbi:HAMP domain-containing protein [Sinorhizobium meliloti]|uniref:HAMP domain-containing protein n=1 Tax=Rhizobium meliloti TaxID=382 RepID=UPI003F5CD713
MQRPIASLVAAVQMLSRGDYQTRVSGQDRADEIRQVAGALDGFRVRLAETKTIEEAAAAAREASETERAQRESERQTADEAQQHVIASLGEGLRHLAAGDLTFRLSRSYQQLRVDFNSAVDGLVDMVSRVNTAVANITNSSRDISSASSNLSQRTEQQAANLEEAAAALNQLTVQINASAEQRRLPSRLLVSARSTML